MASDKEKKQYKFSVEEENAEQRLDLFLTFLNKDLSRSYIKNLINEGLVYVNGAIEYKPHYKVKKGDIIEITEFISRDEPEHILPEKIDIEIIYEDKDLIVVNKPLGMVTHPATGNWTGTLMNALMYHYSQMTEVGSTERSGLIHRLDKDTSGVILIGKTNKGLWHYSKQFAQRRVVKKYLAVSPGNFEKLHGVGIKLVKNFIGRNPTNRKKMAIVAAKKGRLAETKFSLVSGFMHKGKEYSLIEAEPKTGRTHQIRVHLSSLGMPILGDVIYGKSNKYKRLMLHAWKLKIEMLDGKIKTFEAPMPREFSEILNES